MNKSIYTEYANLTPYHKKWLDECGAKKYFMSLSLFGSMKWGYIFFEVKKDGHYLNLSDFYYKVQDYTHLPTGDAFCQGVAEILGIEYVPEGTKTETTTEDKGLAIDVKLLSEKDRKWLGINFCVEIAFKHWAYIGYELGFIYGDNLNDNIPITTDPTEFIRYVANKTGKEWDEKPMFGKNQIEIDLDEQLFPGRQNMGEGALTNEDVMELLGDKVGYGSYKTYRVLDSLNGVPLDKRIPLSEWIPPFLQRVLFVKNDEFKSVYVCDVSKDGLSVFDGVSNLILSDLDGHWMRIV